MTVAGFYVFLRAVHYAARLVTDWTDHVWCEAYLPGEERWVRS